MDLCLNSQHVHVVDARGKHVRDERSWQDVSGLSGLPGVSGHGMQSWREGQRN